MVHSKVRFDLLQYGCMWKRTVTFCCWTQFKQLFFSESVFQCTLRLRSAWEVSAAAICEPSQAQHPQRTREPSTNAGQIIVS